MVITDLECTRERERESREGKGPRSDDNQTLVLVLDEFFYYAEEPLIIFIITG